MRRDEGQAMRLTVTIDGDLFAKAVQTAGPR